MTKRQHLLDALDEAVQAQRDHARGLIDARAMREALNHLALQRDALGAHFLRIVHVEG